MKLIVLLIGLIICVGIAVFSIKDTLKVNEIPLLKDTIPSPQIIKLEDIISNHEILIATLQNKHYNLIEEILTKHQLNSDVLTELTYYAVTQKSYTTIARKIRQGGAQAGFFGALLQK